MFIGEKPHPTVLPSTKSFFEYRPLGHYAHSQTHIQRVTIIFSVPVSFHLERGKSKPPDDAIPSSKNITTGISVDVI